MADVPSAHVARTGVGHFADLTTALDWLDGHVDLESSVPGGPPSRRSVPTLERIRSLARLLGDPESVCPVLHVTGTNGKGSTAAMITNLLLAKGLAVGTYTSPNLSRVNERLSRNGSAIDDAALTEVLSALAALEPLVVAETGDRPSRFELLTAAAFGWFADEAVDASVVEVGLGGTWDATNIVQAAVSVVTNVSWDHTDVLGPTLAGIATEKGGIAKPGGHLVVGEEDPELVGLFRRLSAEVGVAGAWFGGVDFACTSNRLAVGGRLLDIRTPAAVYTDLYLPLHGEHQGRNAACAVAAVEAFFGVPTPADVLEEAFAAVRVPGRLEVLGRHPLVVVDGAHNVAGMEALARSLVEDLPVEGSTVAVLGMLRGRDPSAMLGALSRAGVRSVVACAPPSSRALPAAQVAEAAEALGIEAVAATSVATGLTEALGSLGPDDRCVVAGSLYVVAVARELLCELD